MIINSNGALGQLSDAEPGSPVLQAELEIARLKFNKPQHSPTQFTTSLEYTALLFRACEIAWEAGLPEELEGKDPRPQLRTVLGHLALLYPERAEAFRDMLPPADSVTIDENRLLELLAVTLRDHGPREWTDAAPLSPEEYDHIRALFWRYARKLPDALTRFEDIFTDEERAML